LASRSASLAAMSELKAKGICTVDPARNQYDRTRFELDEMWGEAVKPVAQTPKKGCRGVPRTSLSNS
jgi:hypothetical protein